MKFKIQNSLLRRGSIGQAKFKTNDLIKIILENRGIKSKKEIEEFLNPKLSSVTVQSVGVNESQLRKAITRIKKAIKNKEQIVVFGDYDVDGICGTAVLWETLNSLGAKVMPYIPHRIDEGYGLSIKGIENIISGILKQVQDDNKKGLIITVDNGVVANKAVEFANEQNIDVIITDHHVPSRKLPNALAIVHTVKLCGAGVAWMLSGVILNLFQDLQKNSKEMLKQVQHDNLHESHLELVALATVADLVPLKRANRTLLKFGLEALRKTKRVGLLELLKEAALDKQTIGVYEIGHMIAPRLNAMGRLEYAMDSLRLICTNNKKRAEDLARLLGTTNKERQDLTLNTVLHAIEKVKTQKSKLKSLLFISHKAYEPGVIGLVAGKMVEEFYRPSIVVAIGEKFSKGSARSISGFNIIEFIREHSSFLVDAGGHPMAAGFTVETTRLLNLQGVLEKRAQLLISEKMLTRTLRIDCELPLSLINLSLYESLQKLSPFGMGNPEPTFISRGVVIEDIRAIGKENKHLKLKLACDKGVLEGIAFGKGEMSAKIKTGDKVDAIYVVDENEWNGEKKLQLKVKDLRMFS